MKILLLLSSAFILHISSAQGQIPSETFLKDQVQKELTVIIEGSSAYTGFAAIDLTNAETFLYNEEVAFPQASAIKIPILMEAYKQVSEGKIALNNLVRIKADQVVGGSGMLQALEGDISLSIRNLCILMITQSDNSATNALLDLIGMEEVNKTMEGMGMKSTRLRRKMMDAEASDKGDENTSSPLEAITILQKLYEGAFVNKEVSESILATLALGNRAQSRIASSIPHEVPVGFKPGSLEGVSTEWAFVNLQGRPYAVAIMETLKVAGKSERVMEDVSQVLYQFYFRRGHATPYGSYRTMPKK